MNCVGSIGSALLSIDALFYFTELVVDDDLSIKFGFVRSFRQ